MEAHLCSMQVLQSRDMPGSALSSLQVVTASTPWLSDKTLLHVDAGERWGTHKQDSGLSVRADK